MTPHSRVGLEPDRSSTHPAQRRRAPPGIEREAQRAPSPRGSQSWAAGCAERPREDCPSWDRTRTLLIQSRNVGDARFGQLGRNRPLAEHGCPLTTLRGKQPFWEPRNFDREFEGPVTFRHALSHSRNVITVKILQDIGVGYAITYARKLGISSPLEPNLTLALGSSGVSLLEVTRAYTVFANQGMLVEPLFITKIVDRHGNVLEENKPRLTEAVSPQTAYLMTSLLQSVVEEGTGKNVRALGRPCAAKTGTTNDMRDAWFIGYTPELIAGTWVGFDIEKPLGKKETGAVAASPIWLRFMQEVLAEKPKKAFPIPEGVVFRQVDKETGKSPTRLTGKIIFECFKEEFLPGTL